MMITVESAAMHNSPGTIIQGESARRESRKDSGEGGKLVTSIAKM